MRKRPLCIAALVWAAVVWLLGRAGIPGFGFDPPDFPSEGNKEAVVVSGIIYDISIYENQTVFYLKKTNLFYNSYHSANQQNYPLDRIKVNIRNTESVKKISPGNMVMLYGSLEEIPLPGNPGQFNERAYYYTKKVKWYLKGKNLQILEKNGDKILKYQENIKRFMQKGIGKIFPEEKAGIVEAMVLGEKEHMDKKNTLLFQLLGCSHILAVSGLHLSVLGGGLFRLFRMCSMPLWMAALLSAICMIFYGGVTGNGASVIRAIVMFGISMGSYILKRTYDFLSAVSFAAILLLCETPCYLYNSGFLLSFGAVLGIGVVYPALFRLDKKKHVAGILKKGLFSGFSVWLAILPVVLYFFYEIPLVGIFVSVVLLPFSSILLMSGFVSGVFGNVICKTMMCLFNCPAILILELFIRMGNLIQKIPGAMWTIGQPNWWCCVFYYIAGILFLFLKNKKKTWKITGGILYMAAVFFLLFPLPKGKIEVTFLDVGQGDCACIKTMTGNCYLIDGGSTTVSNVGAYRILPFLKASGISRVQGIFVSHMDADHVNGIEELLEMRVAGESRIKIEKLFLSRCSGVEGKIKELEKLGKKAGCEIYYIEKGSIIKEKNLLSIECIGPEKLYEDSNESSQVLHVSSGNFDLLFTGDVEKQGERNAFETLKKSNTRWEILKVAHHGSGNSTGEEFLRFLRPEISVISCGKNNTYGHPHKELMQRLEKYTRKILLTKDHGAVHICVRNHSFSAK